MTDSADQSADLATLAVRVAPGAELTPAVLDRKVFDAGFPLVSPEATTFAYRGDADAVQLIHFGAGLPEDLKFERLGDSNWWLLALKLVEGARLEYQIEIWNGSDHQVIEDPLNPFQARNPFGQNSVCRSYGYSVPPWALHDSAAEPGSQRSLTIPSEAFGRAVSVSLYLPATFTAEPEHRYPLLILHDGVDYLHYAEAATVLDNLIHRGLIPKFVVAFCEPQDRLTEYANNEPHARFIAEELVPYLEDHLPLLGGRDNRCLGGASFGAVATLSTAVRYPDTFGRLLLQSGSFAGAGDNCLQRTEDLWRPVQDFVQSYVASPTKVADKIFMSCGTFESLICENRVMQPLFKQTGMQTVLGEMFDGHTWGCWRDALGVALPWLFADSFRVRDIRPFERPDPPGTIESVDAGG